MDAEDLNYPIIDKKKGGGTFVVVNERKDQIRHKTHKWGEGMWERGVGQSTHRIDAYYKRGKVVLVRRPIA